MPSSDLTSHAYCTVIPLGYTFKTGAPLPHLLTVAVHVNPVVTQLATTGGPQPLTGVAAFANWPLASGLPFSPAPKVRVHLRVANCPAGSSLESHPHNDVVGTVLALSPKQWSVGYAHPTAALSQTDAQTLWERIFGDCVVAPLTPPAAQTGGATAKGAEYKNVADSSTVAAAARHGANTIQGLGTDELMQQVVTPLLRAHAGDTPTAIGMGADEAATRKTLERCAFLFARQDRLGRAGLSAAQQRQDAKSGTGAGAPKPEFHTTVSSLSDDRPLNRLLGLVFEAEFAFEAAAFPDAAIQFGLGAWVTVDGLAAPLNFVSPGDLPVTPCLLGSKAERRTFQVDCSVQTEQSEILPEGYLSVAGYDTVQFDTHAVVRAALAEYEDGSRVRRAGEAPWQRRPLTLTAHGITVFRRQALADSFLKSVGAALNDPAGFPKAIGGKATPQWQPKQLMRGYAVDVQPVLPGGEEQDWFRLCLRNANYIWEENARFAAKNDEKCLSFAPVEAATPLSGWLLGEVCNPSLLYPLTKADWETLGYENWPAQAEIAPALYSVRCFLVATDFGFIVVGDVPSPDDFPSASQGPIASRAQWSSNATDPASGAPLCNGCWVDFTGAMAEKNGIFLAKEAHFEPAGAAGAAGVVRPKSYQRISASTDSEVIARLEVRREVITIGLAVATDPTWEPVFLRYPAPAVNGPAAIDPLEQWCRTDHKDDAWFFQGRGEPVFSIKDRSNLILDQPLILAFENFDVSTGLLKFSPVVGGDAVDALPVWLKADASTSFSNATRADLQPADLISGHQFQVELRAPGADPPDFTIARMTEQAKPQDATVISVERDASSTTHWGWLTVSISAGSSEKVEVLADTPLRFLVPVPAKQDPAQTTNKAIPPTAATWLEGPWREHGVRLANGDKCQITLTTAPANAGASFRATQIDVTRVSTDYLLIGRFHDEPSSGQAPAADAGEQTLYFESLPLVAPGTPQPASPPPWVPVIIDDNTRIVETPPFATAIWRTHQLPPVQTLTRLFLNPPAKAGGTLRAARVELLTHLPGTGSLPESQASFYTLQLQVQGLAAAIAFKLPRVLPKGFDETAYRALIVGREIEVLAQDEWIGEIRCERIGKLTKNGNGWRFTFDQQEVEVTPALNSLTPQGDYKFTLAFNVAQALQAGTGNALFSINAVASPPSGLALIQLRKLPGANASATAAPVQPVLVLDDPARRFAEGNRQSVSLFTDPGVSASTRNFLNVLLQSQLPIRIDSAHAVLFDQTASASERSINDLHWSLYVPQIPAATDATQTRWLFDYNPLDLTHAVLIQTPMSPDTPWFDPAEIGTQLKLNNLYAVGFEGADQGFAPPPILTGAWPSGVKLSVKAANLANNGDAHLTDQMFVDDSLVHWMGTSLVVKDQRDPSLRDATPATDADHTDQAVVKNVTVDASLPDHELPPLRVGWGYRFRFRAVWITGDAAAFVQKDDESAKHVLNFQPMSSHFPLSAADIKGTGKFLRTEPFAPPRVGWIEHGVADDLIEAGNIDAGWKEAEQYEEKYGLFTPRIAPRRRLECDLGAEIPLNAAEQSNLEAAETALETVAALALLGRRNVSLPFPLKRDGRNRWGSPIDLRVHHNVVPDPKGLIDIPDEPAIAVRPAAITALEAERLEMIDRWLSHHNGADEYRNLLWAYDEVQESEAWWVRNRNQTPETGVLLRRLPDPHAYRPVIEIWSTTDGKLITWADVPDPKALDAFGQLQNRPFVAGCAEWPVLHEICVTVRRAPVQKKDAGKLFVWREGRQGRRLELFPPRDADWSVVVRTWPTAGGISAHALSLYWQQSGVDHRADKEGQSPASGHHRLISPGVTVRVRHMTNQPALAPRKRALLLGPRLAASTHAVFDGTYEIDRASTGALIIQAAREMNYVDTTDSPLPKVPSVELDRILVTDAMPAEPSTDPDQAAPSVKAWGRSSDGLRLLLPTEFAVTPLRPEGQDVIDPAGPALEPARFTHELGDAKHHTVFYRAVAVSRWTDFFLPKDIRTNPPEGPVGPKKFKELQDAAEKAGDAELWRWHRVEVPATVPPAIPVIQRARVSFAWSPAGLSADFGEENGWSRSSPLSGWSFRRTRRAGCRLWLERPWYSSGSGEKLAVLCWHDTGLSADARDHYLEVMSRWGSDPIWEAEPNADLGLLTREAIYSAEPASPANVRVPLPSEPGGGSPPVVRAALALHTPRFHAGEKLWFCDLFVRPRRYTPFLWLSVARYQPHAIPGAALSLPCRLPYPIQALPPRTLWLKARLDAGTLQLEVRVAGLFPERDIDRRSLVCKISRNVTAEEQISDDAPLPGATNNGSAGDEADFREIPALGNEGQVWRPIRFQNADGAETSVLSLVAGTSDSNGEMTFAGQLVIPRTCLVSKDSRLRLEVRECELLPTARRQPAGDVLPGSDGLDSLYFAERPVYGDEVELPASMLHELLGA